MTQDTRKIEKWFSTGDDMPEHPTVQEVVDRACHILDKTYINDGECLGGVLFRADDGKLYTVEAMIDLVEITKEDALERFNIEEEDFV